MDLLVNTFGTRIRSSGERILLSLPQKKKPLEYPIRQLNKIVILRPSSISTNAVQLALEHEVDIMYLGAFGKPIGRILSSRPNGLSKLRRAQVASSDSPTSFDLAKKFVFGKTSNQIAYLRYLEKKYCQESFGEKINKAQFLLSTLPYLNDSKVHKEKLLGIEGKIADYYFTCLKKLHKFPGRKPQNRDKFNSTLNYGYGILYNEVERACLYVGFDPYVGLYHAEGYGKLSLVFDLVEEFRVPIVDSALFPLFIKKEITKQKYFQKIKTKEYQLSTEGRSRVAEAVLQRLNQKITYENKQRTIKDVILLQIQLLARHFLKSQEYQPFIFNTDDILI